MKYVVLDPATQTANLVADTAGHAATGRTIINVADDFQWRYKKVDWSTKTIVDDPASLQVDLLARVKLVSERLSMRKLSSGGAKKAKYAAKAREVENWYAMGPVTSTIGSLVAALDANTRKRKFRFAQADAQKRGDTIAAAIARFETGIGAADDEVARIEAVEQDGVAKIKAAANTLTAKQNAFDAIDWGVTTDVMNAAMGTSTF